MKHLRRNHLVGTLHQRGVAIIMLAVWISTALACLLAVDIGNLFWQQRELQKIADLSALAGASGDLTQNCSSAANAAAQQAATDNKAKANETNAIAGIWSPVGPSSSDFFTASTDANANACEVTVKRSVPYFFVLQTQPGDKSRELSAKAIAVQRPKLAQLSVRSQLLNLDSSKSPLLNALVGGLLGGNLNLSLMSWQGLAGVDLNLLDFISALQVDTRVAVGSYDDLIDADIGVGVLLDVAADVLERSGNTAGVAINALRDIAALGLNVSGLELTLSQLLGLEVGGSQAALNTDLNLLQLVMASVQVANGNSAVDAGISIPLVGLANVGIALKIIEPPQLSLPKNPDLARADPYGDDKIYVRTAQTRLLLSVDLGVLSVLTEVVNGLLKVLSPILNLVSGILGGITSLGEYMIIEALPPPVRVDVSIDVGAAEAYLTDYDCTPNAKTVETDVRAAAINVRLGKWGNSFAQAKANAFSTQSLASMGAIPVLRLDCSGCDGWHWVKRNGIDLWEPKITQQYFGGLGLKLDVPILGNREYIDIPVPDGDGFSPNPVSGSAPPNLIASLGPTVMGLNALPSLPADPRASPAGIQGLLNTISGLLGSVLGLVNSLVLTILAPLLDPIINGLLNLLGLDIADGAVTARLMCGGAPELVY